VIRDAYRPDQFAVHTPQTLDVLPLGGKSKDEYRLTPKELFELGNRHFNRGEMKEATELLSSLIEKWDLKPDYLKQVTQNLLDAHLKIGPAHRVVHHFEIVKEKWPEIVIPHEKILKIGTAYHEMGEYERCWLIYRATVESSFLAESRVAGFLQSQAEVLKSISFMNDLLPEYPAEPYVAAATFDLAQQVYLLAPQARTNEILLKRKVTRVSLIQKAVAMLNSFLSAYPEDPAADQAAFSLATGLLELEKFQSAIDACQLYAKRYPDSNDVDGFLFTVGYCHFALGQTDDALATCEKVAALQRKNPRTGRMEASTHRERAIYIRGQVYHSLGEAAKAIAEYTRVGEQFADAKEAIRYFARRSISIPEVTTIAPGKPVEIDLDFRNVAKCELKVYRIDLMKFGLLSRNLQGITNINLAGIRPNHDEAIELGDGKDYRDRKHKLKLPLEKEGAYLLVCRGDNIHVSGLVLISPFEIEVHEDSSSGRVRTTIKDVVKNKFVSDVHVKVIGSANSDFNSGDSDLRGIYVADGIRGQTTVIAQADGRQYAFYRGENYLGLRLQPNPQAEPQQENDSADASANGKSQSKGALLEGLYKRNGEIQGGNFRRQNELFFNDSKGVKAKAVK
jgi:tetratricopeptide (TPR) repeat protein